MKTPLSKISYTWDKVFKNGPSKICGRQPLRNLKWYGLLKGCLLQIILDPFLNTLLHISHNDAMMKLGRVIPYNPKIYKTHVTHTLSFADIDIFTRN